MPLLIHVPWLPDTWGTRSTALFELVSIFPTVARLAGLPLPVGVDGVDLSALLEDPFSPDAPDAAYHQVCHCMQCRALFSSVPSLLAGRV